MDLFIHNLEKIRKVVGFIVRDYHYRYDVDELINSAYISYRTAIKNNPSLVYDQFNNIHILLKRVRYDIQHYIRTERKVRVKQKMEKVGLTVPLFYNATFLPLNDKKTDKCPIPVEEEERYEDIDIRDTLDYLMNNSGLTDIEKKVIYSRYGVEKTIKETAGMMGISASSVNNVRKTAMEKIQDKIERSCVAI